MPIAPLPGMPRSLWSGSIAFGLVNIPVKLYTAVQPKDVHFHMLHDVDGARIQQKRICPVDGQEVPFDHIVKGYEVAKGRYVVIQPEELKSLDPHATSTIDIARFVDRSQIDPIHYEHSYYLGPDRGAAKAYTLLMAAMQRANKVAIGRVVMRTRQYLALIRPLGKLLAMETLLYADEVVSPDQIEGPANVKLDPSELAMAEQLINALSGDFDPAAWHDEYRVRVLEMVEKKAQGEQIVVQPGVEGPAPVIDLVAALRASLERTRADAGPDSKGVDSKGVDSKGAEAKGTEARSAEAQSSHSQPRRKTSRVPQRASGRPKPGPGLGPVPAPGSEAGAAQGTKTKPSGNGHARRGRGSA